MRRLLRDAEADLTAAPIPEKFEGTLLVSPALWENSWAPRWAAMLGIMPSSVIRVSGRISWAKGRLQRHYAGNKAAG